MNIDKKESKTGFRNYHDDVASVRALMWRTGLFLRVHSLVLILGVKTLRYFDNNSPGVSQPGVLQTENIFVKHILSEDKNHNLGYPLFD